MFTAQEWLQVLGFGALLGTAGQVIRAVAGLKKLSDDAASRRATLGQLFSPSQMVVSVLIGAVAGLLGAISLGVTPADKLPVDKLVALLGIGYAGADFIEAFMAKAGAKGEGAAPAAPAPPPQASAAPAASTTPSEKDAVG